MVSRTPDYLLKVIHRESDRKSGKLGAAWKNDDGSISISLDPCVVLSGNDDLGIRLWPNVPFDASKKAAQGQQGKLGDDDDEPF